jgi:hypothetical protein
MLRTITVGNHIQVQGLFVRSLENGKVIVSVGEHQYQGQLVERVN